MFKKIMSVLLLALIVIQFINPKKNKADGEQPNAIGNSFAIPSDVKTIMAKACYDCHSNNTRYPWYAKLQPIHWWMDSHIHEGKGKINYDEFTNRSLRYQYKKMEETAELVKEGEMPIKSYKWTHKDARLTTEERTKITSWAQSVMDTMKAKYPIDSLIRKKS